jgi:hypothetical protein
MFVKYFDLELVLDLGPVGELERHILIIVEDCATNRHFFPPRFTAQFIFHVNDGAPCGLGARVQRGSAVS